jgi:hypothetical protein
VYTVCLVPFEFYVAANEFGNFYFFGAVQFKRRVTFNEWSDFIL